MQPPARRAPEHYTPWPSNLQQTPDAFQRQAIEVGTDLDHVRIEQRCHIVEGFSQRRHARFSVRGEVVGDLIDHGGRD
nr:hypothetical protein [Tanacetum cinerariifolium]